MSGRSAYVRKEKTKVKHGIAVTHDAGSEPSLPSLTDFPAPKGGSIPFWQEEVPAHRTTSTDHATIRSQSDKSDDNRAYARVRRPPVPVIDVSGIEKSAFRSVMDKRSEGVRKGLVKAFGGKKKKDKDKVQRPETANTMRTDRQEEDEAAPPPSVPRARNQPSLRHLYQQYTGPHELPASATPPPPGKLPPIPQGPQLMRWYGKGRAPHNWNKLAKDPELWEQQGDTLVYLCDRSQKSHTKAAFRISSHVVESTESTFLVSLLHEGAVEEDAGYSMPPSPISSNSRQAFSPPRNYRGHTTLPTPEGSMGEWEEQISFEMFFPPPHGETKIDTLRHQITTRNFFAILHQKSLVGLSLIQALRDVQDRMETYMPADHDSVSQMIDYLCERGINDFRESPCATAAILAWSEDRVVRWVEGWKDAFVHASGMFTQVEACADYRFVSPITRALLQRASLETTVRVQECEKYLSSFDFADMWPATGATSSPSRAAFDRAQLFFYRHYKSRYDTWPPPKPPGAEQWLTRPLAKKLMKDFGSLYDYLVNREVCWDSSQERNGRYINLVYPGNQSFDADTPDLPFTDLIMGFDARRKYPNIPSPYPLVPESIPALSVPLNSSKKAPPQEDKIAQRRAALAYSESTNIFILGTEFQSNDLVDDFIEFEKSDRPGGVDPYTARRGRWVLIYGILQVLGSVSVDTPGLSHTDNVLHHLSPRLNGTPPWRGNNSHMEEASHIGSHCWTVRHKWQPELPFTLGTRRVQLPPHMPLSISTRSTAASVSGYSESDASSSYRSPISHRNGLTQRSRKRSDVRYQENGKYHDLVSGNLVSYTGYTPGIEKVGEWPVRQESKRGLNAQTRTSSRAGSKGGDRETIDTQSHAGSMPDRSKDGSRSRSRTDSSHDKEVSRRDMMPQDFTIKDLETYSFSQGTGSLGLTGALKLGPTGEWVGGKREEDEE